MSTPVEVNGIRFASCTASEVDDVAGLIGRVFAGEEPLALAVGLTAHEIQGLVEAIFRGPEVAAVTIVAREVGSDQLAAALLAEDAANPPVEPDGGFPAAFMPLLGLFDELAGRRTAGMAAQPGPTLHLVMLAADPHFAGRGIGQQLVQASLENGALFGFRAAITEATGRVSQHIFEKSGFATQAQVDYAAFTYDGRKPFASIAEHAMIKAMGREIGKASREIPAR